MQKQPELRRLPRKRVALRALVTERSGTPTTSCLIRDVSQFGCSIVCSKLNQLSDEISMTVEGVDSPVEGRIVWRRGKTAGVKLIWADDGQAAELAEVAEPNLPSNGGPHE